MEPTKATTDYKERDFPSGGRAQLRVTAGDANDVLGVAELQGFVDGVYHTVAFAKRGAAFCAHVFHDTGASAPATLPPAEKAVATAYHLGCGNADKQLEVLIAGSVVWKVDNMNAGVPRQFVAGKYVYDAVLGNDTSRTPLLATAAGGASVDYDFRGQTIYRMYFARVGSTTPVAAVLPAYNPTNPIPDDVQLEAAPVESKTFGQKFKDWFVDNPLLIGVLAGGLCLLCCVIIAAAYFYNAKKRREDDMFDAW